MSFPASIAYSIIETAAAVLGGQMESSAQVCLNDARQLWNEGRRFDYAAGRALASISYSRGVLSPEYKFAALAFEEEMGWAQ